MHFYTTRNNRKLQKIAKNFKKLKKYHYGFISSQNRMQKTEKDIIKKKEKFIVPFRSYPTGYRKFQKNTKKTPKTIKYHYGIISSQRRLEKAEK